jgi:PAS domain S-box-containing protein
LEDYPTRCLPFEFVQSLTLAADRPRLDQALNLLLNHDVPYEQEYSIQRASDKQLHQVVSKAEVVRDAQGRPFKVLGTVQDITERKRAEEEIKKREATLRGILKASPSGIAMVSFPQRCLVWANERLCEMTGYRLEDLLGMPTSLLYLDDDEYERVGRQATEEIKTNGFSTLQSRWRGQDGRGLDVLLNVSAIHPDDLSAGLVFTALDVTQRVRAEEEIRQSEATLQSILKASPSGIAMITYTDRRLIWANQRMAEITGYPLDELLGMPTRKLYFDDNEYEKASQRTRQGIRAQGFSTFQALARAKDGRALDILMNVAPMIPEDPKAGLVFTALDITQRVRAEEEIRQSEATLRSILKASPSGIAQVSYPARRIIWANERMSEMTGYPVQDLLGMSTRDLYLDPHDFDLTAAEVPEMLMSRGVASFESQWSRRDGAVMDVLINVSPLNPHDLAAGQVSSVLDITDSKRAQELVRRNEEKYRLILEATPDPVVLYDMKGLVVYLNPAFTRVFGWTLEELAGRKVDYVPQDELAKTDEMIALMQQGTFLSDFETRRYDRWGNILSVAVSWSAWRDENGTPAGSVVVLRDVTEHKKMLAQLEQARKMEAVGTLAGGIAHDFNNVLQAISGNVQLLMMSPELDARPKKTLADIDNLTQRAAEMIQQLLTISRKREVKLQAVSLDQEVRQMCRLLERIIPKMITMDLQLDPNLWPINGDQTQLEQIILNLAGNAADAMPQGGTLTFQTENQDIDEVFCRTHPELRPGPHVLLRVADTGQGMDKETLKHLFEPFFTTKQSGQGTGLGLSTVYGIVTSHLGLITCYSTPGQGTAFNLYFPALIGEEGSRYRAYPRLEEGPRGGSETLLLVDDEADILQVGREILGMFGYSVLTCASGEEALSLYSDKSDEIDLVILDLNMPGMGGHRCLEGLLHVDPQARVIISSGYYTHLTARDLGKAGARGFIAKPYRLSDMVKRVREVLDNVQA